MKELKKHTTRPVGRSRGAGRAEKTRSEAVDHGWSWLRGPVARWRIRPSFKAGCWPREPRARQQTVRVGPAKRTLSEVVGQTAVRPGQAERAQDKAADCVGGAG